MGEAQAVLGVGRFTLRFTTCHGSPTIEGVESISRSISPAIELDVDGGTALHVAAALSPTEPDDLA